MALIKKLFNQVTQMLGIAGRLDHRPSELSGGEQQRVALARAVVNGPALILADEPTGNLDSKNSDIVLKMLRDANKQFGQTVLMITHNPEAAEIGDRIIHMRDGLIVSGQEDPQWASKALILSRSNPLATFVSPTNPSAPDAYRSPR